MKKDIWINHPTKKQLILVLTTWFLGTGLSILSATNLFTESVFQKGYFMLYFIIAGATFTAIKVLTNYKKTL